MNEHSQPFNFVILPRKSMGWDEFSLYPGPVIALDGVVRGGPRIDLKTGHFNYDHHDNVVREATMSTCMQVYYAIKGGLIEALTRNGELHADVLINDTDQDTSLAASILQNYKKFEGVQSIPHFNRLLELTNRWDITGGAFPMNLDDQIVRQHNWVFRPYSDLRKSGALAQANEAVLRDNLDAVLSRLNRFIMGQAEEVALDTRHNILYDSPRFKIIDEIGGSEARYHLFNQGLKAFVSLVARRSDGRFVYSIGKLAQYIPFPVEQLYDDLNAAEGFDRTNGWGCASIIGGSSRQHGSGLSWEQIRDIVNARLDKDEKVT